MRRRAPVIQIWDDHEVSNAAIDGIFPMQQECIF